LGIAIASFKRLTPLAEPAPESRVPVLSRDGGIGTFRFWQGLTILLVSVGMALPLSHGLEFPGKRRLPREAYFAAQTIYYPGFTIEGAFGGFGAIVATLILLAVTPFASRGFWPTLVGALAMLSMRATYWVWTHPANKIWLQDQKVGGAGERFFATGRDLARRDWTELRDRWEWSRVARASFAIVALIALLVAGLAP